MKARWMTPLPITLNPEPLGPHTLRCHLSAFVSLLRSTTAPLRPAGSNPLGVVGPMPMGCFELCCPLAPMACAVRIQTHGVLSWTLPGSWLVFPGLPLGAGGLVGIPVGVVGVPRGMLVEWATGHPREPLGNRLTVQESG